MGFASGAISVAGDRGFTLLAYTSVVGGVYGPFEFCSASPQCGPGSTIPLDSFWSGNDLPGIATLDGNVYPSLGSFSVNQSALVEFRGSAVAPSLGVGDSAVVSAPFTFTGLFTQPLGPGLNSGTVRHDLVGSGTATLWLAKDFDGTHWQARASRYQFEPLATPEPGTLILVGSGFALAYARKRFKGWRR